MNAYIVPALLAGATIGFTLVFIVIQFVKLARSGESFFA